MFFFVCLFLEFWGFFVVVWLVGILGSFSGFREKRVERYKIFWCLGYGIIPYQFHARLWSEQVIRPVQV